MTTKTHTLVLSTPRFDIQSKPNVIEIANSLIHSKLVNVDYFGIELDNQADYIDEEMALKMSTSTFITFHFDENIASQVDYDCDEEVILNLILSILMENQIREVLVYENEIDVYIY